MNVKEFLSEAKDVKGYLIAALTDRYIVDFWPMCNDKLDGLDDKILEIHIFNKDEERRLFRSNISERFYDFVLNEENKGDYYDEYQYLDIDDNRVRNAQNGGCFVHTTGGGKYYLPMENSKNACIRIRYYLDRYPQTGQSRVCNWRLVDFMEGE